MQAPLLQFGRFAIEPDRRSVLADGRPLRIGARAFDLLLALAEAGGAVLSRDALFERVWSDGAVTDDNLKVQVMALRKLLGADAVVTVPRRGYRLGLPVHAAVEQALQPAHGLIGRDSELSDVRDRLAAGRLLTIVGSGGMGKTRLALAASEQSAARFADGRCVVELAALTDPQMLLATVARALQLPSLGAASDAASVAAAMRPLALLLVLDNCEHLRGAAAQLAQAVLDSAPRVALLATSQEPLGIGREQVLRLTGLRWPAADDDNAGPQLLLGEPAVALFIARAQAADQRFVLDRDSAPAVATICRELEGQPLAIELAAARVPLLGVHGVRARLHQQLQLLTRGAAGAPARQQSLRAALHWSHALLDEAQQAVFRRLGVFADSFGFDSAVQVVGRIGDAAADGDPQWELIDVLDALVAKSLLHTVDIGRQRRFRLLDAARAFALELLAAAGEQGALQQRHALATLAVFEAIDAAHAATPLLELDARVQPELGNLRAALAFALRPGGQAALAVGFAAAAGGALAASGLFDEAAQALDAVRSRVDLAPPLQQARYWLALANRGADSVLPAQQTYDAVTRALALFRGLGDVEDTVRCLSLAVQHGHRVGAGLDVCAIAEEMRQLEPPTWTALQRRSRRWIEARALVQRGDWQAYGDRMRVEVTLLQEAGDEWRAWVAAHGVALAEITLGRPRAAVEAMAPALSQIRARGMTRRCWQQVAIHAMACIASEDPDLAAPAVREAVAVMRVAGSMAWMCTHLSWWVMQRGDSAAAARMHAWAGARIAAHGETLGPHVVAARERVHQYLVANLAGSALDELLAEGARLSDDEAAVIAVRAGG